MPFHNSLGITAFTNSFSYDSPPFWALGKAHRYQASPYRLSRSLLFLSYINLIHRNGLAHFCIADPPISFPTPLRSHFSSQPGKLTSPISGEHSRGIYRFPFFDNPKYQLNPFINKICKRQTFDVIEGLQSVAVSVSRYP